MGTLAGQLPGGVIRVIVELLGRLENPVAGLLATAGVAIAPVEHIAGNPARNLSRPGHISQGGWLLVGQVLRGGRSGANGIHRVGNLVKGRQVERSGYAC